MQSDLYTLILLITATYLMHKRVKHLEIHSSILLLLLKNYLARVLRLQQRRQFVLGLKANSSAHMTKSKAFSLLEVQLPLDHELGES